MSIKLYKSGKRRDIIKNAVGSHIALSIIANMSFFRRFWSCVGVTFTVLFRLFRHFHADTELFQTNIAEYSECMSVFVLYTHKKFFYKRR